MRRATRCAGDPCRRGAAGPLLVDQPPDRRTRADLPRDRRASRARPGPAGRRGAPAVPGARGRRRPTSSSPGITPGRATPCRASRCSCTTARPAGPAACSSGCSGPIPTRSADRSPPRALRRIAATGALGAWAIRRLVPAAQHVAALTGSPAAFMIRWARELVVDRTVLVYAPPLREQVGPRLGPVRLYSDLDQISGQWSVVSGQREDRQRVEGEVTSRFAYASFPRAA